MRRLLALVVAMVLVIAMALPVYAESSKDVTITAAGIILLLPVADGNLIGISVIIK